MKKTIFLTAMFLIGVMSTFAETGKTKSPFSKLGYKKQVMYTSSKGEFDEFHSNADVVEIGSVYFNTKTNEVVGMVDPEKEQAQVASATSAMSVDPLCEKYYWISPYAYCAGNPVNRIDPTGMDWYQSENGVVTMWREGNSNIDGYTNIGTTYTQNIDDHTTVTFTQNEATSMTYTGAEESSWESQIANGTNCYEASAEMLQNEGVETAGRGFEILVTGAAANGRAGDANGNASTGFTAVDRALENGDPIMVGVDYRNGSPNVDGRTDHFIVISSKTDALSNGAVTSTTYNYFDPRTSHQNYGTSSNNQLTISNNRMTGSYNHGGSNYNYIVTTVRRNR